MECSIDIYHRIVQTVLLGCYRMDMESIFLEAIPKLAFSLCFLYSFCIFRLSNFYIPIYKECGSKYMRYLSTLPWWLKSLCKLVY